MDRFKKPPLPNKRVLAARLSNGDAECLSARVKDQIRAIEAEFEEPITDVLRGFVEADGFSLTAAAGIVELPRSVVQALCGRYGIRATADEPLIRERSTSAKRRISSTLRRRAGHCALHWRGQSWTFVELSEQTGIPPDTIRMRLKLGWPLERAVSDSVMSPAECGRLAARRYIRRPYAFHK